MIVKCRIYLKKKNVNNPCNIGLSLCPLTLCEPNIYELFPVASPVEFPVDAVVCVVGGGADMFKSLFKSIGRLCSNWLGQDPDLY